MGNEDEFATKENHILRKQISDTTGIKDYTNKLEVFDLDLLSKNYKILEKYQESQIEVRSQSEKITVLEKSLNSKERELIKTSEELDFQKD